MNEAGPTMRLHLHVPTAVQGELFPASDAQLVTRGYRVQWHRGCPASLIVSLIIGRAGRLWSLPSLHRMGLGHVDCIRSRTW